MISKHLSKIGCFCAGGSAGRQALAKQVLQLHSSARSTQGEAAIRIAALASDSLANTIAIIAAGAVPPLVALLRSELPAVQRPAAGALWNLAVGSQHSKEAIIAAGAVPPLVALLRSDQSVVRREAAGALQNLAANFQEARVPPLQQVLCLRLLLY